MQRDSSHAAGVCDDEAKQCLYSVGSHRGEYAHGFGRGGG